MERKPGTILWTVFWLLSSGPSLQPLGEQQGANSLYPFGKMAMATEEKTLGRSAVFLDRKTKQMVDGVLELTHSVPREQIDWNFLSSKWNIRGFIKV